MKIAVTKEIRADESRVAASPETVKKYRALGFEVLIETGAGDRASISDSAFAEAGAEIVSDAASALEGAEILLKVQRPMTKEEGGVDETSLIKPGTILIANMQSLSSSAVLALQEDFQIRSRWSKHSKRTRTTGVYVL